MGCLLTFSQDFKMLKRRLKNKHQKGETVYIARNPADADRNLYKIGHTKDLSKRSGQYATAMPDGAEIVHRVQTCNAHLVERVVHHVLAKWTITVIPPI